MTEKLSLNQQIEQILAQENAQLEQRLWRWKFKRIWKAENKKEALKAELFAMWRGLSKKGVFTLFLIVTFVFMLILSVL